MKNKFPQNFKMGGTSPPEVGDSTVRAENGKGSEAAAACDGAEEMCRADTMRNE